MNMVGDADWQREIWNGSLGVQLRERLHDPDRLRPFIQELRARLERGVRTDPVVVYVLGVAETALARREAAAAAEVEQLVERLKTEAAKLAALLQQPNVDSTPDS